MDNKIEFKHKNWTVSLLLPIGYEKKHLVFFFDTLSETENFIKNNYKKFHFTPRRGKNAIRHNVTYDDGEEQITFTLQIKTFTVIDNVLYFDNLTTLPIKKK